MDDELRNDSDTADSATSDDDRELNLRMDADLAANIMLDNEGARLASLSQEDRLLVAAGLAEKLKRASREQGLDVAELRQKLELSQSLRKEEAHEL
jgi:hypothetical protein